MYSARGVALILSGLTAGSDVLRSTSKEAQAMCACCVPMEASNGRPTAVEVANVGDVPTLMFTMCQLYAE